MNNKAVAFIENLCRTCMSSDEEVDKQIDGRNHRAFSIFNTPESMECKNITIMELLMLTTPQLSIEKSDMLPKSLCESCLERLVSVYKFQEMCIKVEQTLRQMLTGEIAIEPKIDDPLQDNLKNISVENEDVTKAINDLSNILKIEMDEPLIDQEDNNDVALEIRWDDGNDSEASDGSNDSVSESDWETETYDIKSKRSKKLLRKLSDKEDKNSTDATAKKEEETSEIINESNEGSTIITKNNTESKKFICDECGNHLATRKSLKRHKRIHLRPVVVGQRNKLAKTKHECDFCKKVFQQSSSLKDHLRTHTGEQPYLCSECGKSFKSLSNMKQHFLRHGTDRPYACPDCPKSFPCLSDLASHKAVHNKTKSHVCDLCGAAFVKPYLLKKHKMYHTGEKNHKCDYCDMRFVLADQCRRHMRTHTGEKPYKCKYCERAFAQSNDLIKHLRGHLGDNVYKCDLCPQGFRLQGDLRAHFNTHKNDDEETRARNLQALKDEEHKLQIKFGLIKCT